MSHSPDLSVYYSEFPGTIASCQYETGRGWRLGLKGPLGVIRVLVPGVHISDETLRMAFAVVSRSNMEGERHVY